MRATLTTTLTTPATLTTTTRSGLFTGAVLPLALPAEVGGPVLLPDGVTLTTVLTAASVPTLTTSEP